jgi:hypothetical protein
VTAADRGAVTLIALQSLGAIRSASWIIATSGP